MKRHSTLNLDEDLINLAKLIGGRGVLSELCNDTLRCFVFNNEDSEKLTDEDRRRIAYVRAKYDRINGEKEIIRDCWENHIKKQFAPVIARHGPRKRVMDDLMDGIKEWLFDRYDRLPTEAQITETFQELYKGEFYYWQAQRAIAYKIKREAEAENERETSRSIEEFNRGIEDYAEKLKEKVEPRAPELPSSPEIIAAEVSNGRS